MAERDKPRDERPRGNRPQGDRPQGDRPQGGQSRAGGRLSGDRSGYKPRSGKPTEGRSDYRPGARPSSRPTSDRPASDRSRNPYAGGADRARADRRDDDRARDSTSRDDRSGGYPRRASDAPQDRSRTSRPYSERTGADRPRQSRPYAERGGSDRPGDRPRAPRPYGDHGSDRPYPSRPRTERPYQQHAPSDGPRSDRPFESRPRTDRPRPDRPYTDRPHRPPFDARRPYTSRPAYGARPQREATVDRDALVGEGEELIAGRRPVEEAFAARREAVRLLIVPERRAALDALAIHATTLRIPVVEVEGGSLTSLAGFDGHQGVALVARAREAGTVEQILVRARERGETPFVLVLDSLEDPQNFGTLLRTAEAAGVHGVIYPTRRSAPLSPSAIKASAGATEHLVLAAVDDLAGTLADLHGDGLRVVGADEDASMPFSDADLRGPLAIIVGSEGRGISGSVRRRLDLVVKIPMRGKIESLNAAVAGSILLFAAAVQRPLAERAKDDQSAPKPTQKPAPKKRATKVAPESSEPSEAT